MAPTAMVGRQAELERLTESVGLPGSFVLLAGEAGVGKTRLVHEVARSSGRPALIGRAAQSATAPYGPITEVLRGHLRSHPDALDGAGPLASHLAPVLPELGSPGEETDRAALLEALRRMLAAISADGPRLVLLDDLHWSDEATLELIPGLAGAIADLPLLVVGSYRSDGLPRDHLLRRVRHELRRAGRLDEIVLAPLDREGTAELVAGVMGEEPEPELVATIHDRTQGLPFFVEELARALQVTGDAAPLPDTIRDAVMVSTSGLSAEAKAAADAAAVAGDRFPLDVVAQVGGADGLAELVGSGLAVERDDGTGTFRHALTREALYADIPWLQRRSLHRRLAEELERTGAESGQRAAQWLGAREEGRAREALLEAARESCAVHAYRDAARDAQQALELWPEGEEVEGRLAALDLYARSAEYSGQLAEAARALREACAIEAANGAGLELAEAQRRLGGVHDLRGDRDAAATARRAAADSFASQGRPAEAAVELMALANYLRASADYSAATELTQAALREAERAERVDLRARALGLDGVVREKGGDPDGLQTVREGLALALEHDLTSVAAELYQRLSLALYDSADYRRAREALDSALELCEAGDSGTEVACVTCLVYVLRESGEWDEALSLSRELIESDTAVWVAEGLMGVILGYQGKFASARRLLIPAYAAATKVDHFNMSVDTASGLAWVAAAQGETEQATEHYRWLLDRWERSEDHHYAVRGLRQGAAFLARQGDLRAAQGCSEVLATIAADTGGREALAALAHSIGEAALAEGDAATAAEQLGHAVEAHRSLDTPLERAEISLRAGVAAAAAGDRELGLERLGDAYRLARKLGARPLAAEAADEVSALGESVVGRLGRRADAVEHGLTRRELEVMRHVAAGQTNKEIAQELFLSPRTVDMHVRNILRKLDCPSRAAAASRAGELGLLAG